MWEFWNAHKFKSYVHLYTKKSTAGNKRPQSKKTPLVAFFCRQKKNLQQLEEFKEFLSSLQHDTNIKKGQKVPIKRREKKVSSMSRKQIEKRKKIAEFH